MSQSRNAAWPKTKPVIVRWVDSMGTNGWNAVPGAKMECVTIGNLVEKQKDRVCVAMNRSHYSDGDLIEIPLVSVRSIKGLKE